MPFGGNPQGGTDGGDASRWIESCAVEEGFRLVTLSMDGLLVGFVAGVVTPGRVELRHLTMASSVRTRHPELLDLLGEAFVDASQMPWAEVVVAPAARRSPISPARRSRSSCTDLLTAVNRTRAAGCAHTRHKVTRRGAVNDQEPRRPTFAAPPGHFRSDERTIPQAARATRHPTSAPPGS